MRWESGKKQDTFTETEDFCVTEMLVNDPVSQTSDV